jgi:hypothetical protein
MSNAPAEKPGQTGGKSDKSQQQRKGDTGQSGQSGQSGKGGQQQQGNPTGARQPKPGGSQQDPKSPLPRYDDRPEQGSRGDDDDETEGASQQTGEPRYGDREKDDPRRSHVEGQRKEGSGGEQRQTPGSTNR